VRSGGLRLVQAPAHPAQASPPVRDQAEALIRSLEEVTVTGATIDGHTVYALREELEPLLARGAKLVEMPLWPPDRPLRRTAAVIKIRESGLLSERSAGDVITTLWWYRVDTLEHPEQLNWWNPSIFDGPLPDRGDADARRAQQARGAA
jgi:hypothetical protein